MGGWLGVRDRRVGWPPDGGGGENIEDGRRRDDSCEGGRRGGVCWGEDSGDRLEGRRGTDAGAWRGEDTLMAPDRGGRGRPWQLRGHPGVKREEVGEIRSGELGEDSFLLGR